MHATTASITEPRRLGRRFSTASRRPPAAASRAAEAFLQPQLLPDVARPPARHCGRKAHAQSTRGWAGLNVTATILVAIVAAHAGFLVSMSRKLFTRTAGSTRWHCQLALCKCWVRWLNRGDRAMLLAQGVKHERYGLHSRICLSHTTMRHNSDADNKMCAEAQ